ncbi:MAG: hypothetical protein IJ086_00895 [Clostridium sp.]|nr:hypothetical protein [Clostridium sp.]
MNNIENKDDNLQIRIIKKVEKFEELSIEKISTLTSNPKNKFTFMMVAFIGMVLISFMLSFIDGNKSKYIIIAILTVALFYHLLNKWFKKDRTISEKLYAKLIYSPVILRNLIKKTNEQKDRMYLTDVNRKNISKEEYIMISELVESLEKEFIHNYVLKIYKYILISIIIMVSILNIAFLNLNTMLFSLLIFACIMMSVLYIYLPLVALYKVIFIKTDKYNKKINKYIRDNLNNFYEHGCIDSVDYMVLLEKYAYIMFEKYDLNKKDCIHILEENNISHSKLIEKYYSTEYKRKIFTSCIGFVVLIVYFSNGMLGIIENLNLILFLGLITKVCVDKKSIKKIDNIDIKADNERLLLENIYSNPKLFSNLVINIICEK